MLVSDVQQSDSVIHIYILFHYGLSEDIEYSFLCYTVRTFCLSQFASANPSLPTTSLLHPHKRTFWGDEMFCILIGVVVTGTSMFVITPSNYMFNMGAFIVCKLYLSSDFFQLLELFSCVPWLMAYLSIFKVNSVLLQSTTLFFCLSFPLHPYLLGGIPCSMWDLSSLIRDPTYTPTPQHLKRKVLTTGPPGKSHLPPSF